VTHALTDQTADDLVAQVGRVPRTTPVVIDLTAIPAFDSDGAEKLLGLQDQVGADRLSIVGFRQAASRLIGADAAPAAAPPTPERQSAWQIRRLRNLAVVQAGAPVVESPGALEQAIASAMEDDVAIVVVDLRPVLTVTAEAVQVLAFASSSAALRGQELLIVNVSAEAAQQLRQAGMSATTYVAPEPLLDPPR
jgi:anti-anti-sigma regulatory factor